MVASTEDLAVVSDQGIDVSSYNKSAGEPGYNWAGTRGLKFGLFRLTEGVGAPGENSPDPTAPWNHEQILKKGLYRGAYHLGRPGRSSGPAQATYFVSEYVKLGLTQQDMLILDHEETDGLSPAEVSAFGDGFMHELDQLTPHNPRLVYTYIDFARTGNCVGLGKWPSYIAYPNNTAPTEPPPWLDWTFWQWGQRNGVDRDAFNTEKLGDLGTWIRSYAPTHFLVRHVSDGTRSLVDVAHAKSVTVQTIARWTMDRVNHHNAMAFVMYLTSPDLGPAKKMPPGLVYWAESA